MGKGISFQIMWLFPRYLFPVCASPRKVWLIWIYSVTAGNCKEWKWIFSGGRILIFFFFFPHVKPVTAIVGFTLAFLWISYSISSCHVLSSEMPFLCFVHHFVLLVVFKWTNTFPFEICLGCVRPCIGVYTYAVFLCTQINLKHGREFLKNKVFRAN